MSLGNFFDLETWQNVRDSWLSGQGLSHYAVLFMKFGGWEKVGNPANTDEQFRQTIYETRREHVYLSEVKVFDTVKGGYFTTGDLDVASTFRIQGYSAAYTLPSGVKIPEYGGDKLIWNGKVWAVADQIMPIQFGYQAKQIWWKTVMRRTDRSGIGNVVGP